jgi:hypothetical protein
MAAKQRALLSVAVLGASLVAAPALAEDDWEQCSAAYEQAQVDRRDGHLLEARRQLAVCVRPECPETARRDCDQWLAEVEASIPTVVLDARDGSGRQLTAVTVLLDGEPLALRLDGVSLEVDPGPHTFRFETAGEAPIERTITILEGEKNQKVSVSWAKAASAPAPRPPPPPTPDRPTGGDGTPTGAWILGGVGLVAMGTFAFFGVSALGDETDLEDTCGLTRTCTEGDIDEVHAKRVAADVSLGIGVVCIVTSAIWLIADSASDPPDQSAAGPAGLASKIDFALGWSRNRTELRVLGVF